MEDELDALQDVLKVGFVLLCTQIIVVQPTLTPKLFTIYFVCDCVCVSVCPSVCVCADSASGEPHNAAECVNRDSDKRSSKLRSPATHYY